MYKHILFSTRCVHANMGLYRDISWYSIRLLLSSSCSFTCMKGTAPFMFRPPPHPQTTHTPSPICKREYRYIGVHLYRGSPLQAYPYIGYPCIGDSLCRGTPIYPCIQIFL